MTLKERKVTVPGQVQTLELIPYHHFIEFEELIKEIIVIWTF